MKINYDVITSLYFQTDCTCISTWEWDALMEGHVRANKKKIDVLVKKFLPGLYDFLALEFPNPYKYYRTKTHLVLVHSSIEYFLKFN